MWIKVFHCVGVATLEFIVSFEELQKISEFYDFEYLGRDVVLEEVK